MNNFEFSLVETTGSKQGGNDYFPEEKLLVEENGKDLMKSFLIEFYKEINEVPYLSEIVEEVHEYNGEVLYEMGYYELQANCLTCKERNFCWPEGVPPPDLIESIDPTDSEKTDQCYADYFEIACNYVEYNYPDYFGTEELILGAIGELGYAVVLNTGDLDYVYENAYNNKTVYYEGIHEVYFNDAQQVLVSEFAHGTWEPNYLALKHPLLTTG